MNQSSSPTPAPIPGGLSVGERHTAIIGGPSRKGEMWPRPWGVWSAGGYVMPSQKTPDLRSAKGHKVSVSTEEVQESRKTEQSWEGPGNRVSSEADGEGTGGDWGRGQRASPRLPLSRVGCPITPHTGSLKGGTKTVDLHSPSRALPSLGPEPLCWRRTH